MAEEEQESTGKSFKGIIITLVSTVTLGVGGFITNKLTGGDKEETPIQQVAQPSIIINNSQQQQAAGGKSSRQASTSEPNELAITEESAQRELKNGK